MTTIIVRKRLYTFVAPGSMGLVTDTRYVRCFWPRLEEPTEMFAPGSSGIEVEGPPSPRNVVFPPGTVFLGGTRPDCFFLRHRQVVSEREVPLPGGGTVIKQVTEAYVAELSEAEARDLCQGKTTRAALDATARYCRIKDNPRKAATRLYARDANGALAEVAREDEALRSERP